MQFLSKNIFNNSVQQWLIALSIFLVIYLGFAILKKVLSKRLNRLVNETKNDFDNFLKQQLSQTRLIFVFFLAIYFGSVVLTLSQPVSDFLRILTIIVFILQAAFWGMGLIDYLVRRKIEDDHEEEEVTATTMRAFSLVAKIALWSIVVLLILGNITGLEISALIATLGISSVAVALAVQNILSDLFSSISIAIDKPFVIGDSIAVDEFSGTVEDIGLKSTRLRSISGEQLIFSNSDLLNSRIRNFQHVERRRVTFIIGVIYQTSPEKLAAIPGILREIIEANENVSFERAHFIDFGASALEIECIYFVDIPDFQENMNIRHTINLAIFERFQAEGIEFAYPTQTVFVEGNNQEE